MPQKHYVVWIGRIPGVYDTWEQCQAQVNGFVGARYMKFDSKEEAELAFKNGPDGYWGKKTEKAIANMGLGLPKEVIEDSIAVDASCSGVFGPMEFRGVSIKDKKVVFRFGPYPKGSNNVGEFLAIVEALKHLKKLGSNDPIYSDSRVAMGWVRHKVCNTKLPNDNDTKNVFKLIEDAIDWLKNNKYPNKILKWKTETWGEIPADYGKK